MNWGHGNKIFFGKEAKKRKEKPPKRVPFKEGAQNPPPFYLQIKKGRNEKVKKIFVGPKMGNGKTKETLPP